MTERSRPLVLALLLFLVPSALYARTGGFPFVEFDDPAYVRDNPHLAQGLTDASMRWAFTSTDYQYNWHPLTWISHALDVELFGLDAGRHHLVNALLHALNAALLFLALRALSGRTWPCAFVAALFAVHPLRVESVVWVAQRKDLLAGTCFAASLLAYVRYARSPSLGRQACVALACAAGLMAKPTLVTLPFVLFLLDLWPLGRASFSKPAARSPVPPPSLAPTHPGGQGAEGPGAGFRYGVFSFERLFLEKTLLFGLSAGAVLLTLVAQRSGGAIKPLAFVERLLNAASAYLTYLGQYLFPRDLAVFYPHPALFERTPSVLVAALAAVLLLGLGATLAWRARHRAPWLAVGLCWFLGMLVPMIGLVQVGNQAHADRYAYLPMLGLELALAFGAAELVRARPAWRKLVIALALLWLGALALVATRQIGFWRSSEALFEHALAVTERNFVAHNNLGLALAKEQRLDEALAHFEAAAELKPGFYEAELNAGKARQRRGEFALARAAFERAVAARPASGEARLELARTLARLGDAQGADAELARALECQPSLAQDPRARRLGEELLELEGDE